MNEYSSAHLDMEVLDAIDIHSGRKVAIQGLGRLGFPGKDLWGRL